jgi:hypothetical protein
VTVEFSNTYNKVIWLWQLLIAPAPGDHRHLSGRGQSLSWLASAFCTSSEDTCCITRRVSDPSKRQQRRSTTTRWIDCCHSSEFRRSHAAPLLTTITVPDDAMPCQT